MLISRAFALCLLSIASCAQSAGPAAPTWSFAVSGDSRNCGDVVMPAIAEQVQRDGAEFYWHLGDLRLISKPDEDYVHEPEHQQERKNDLLLLANYEKNAWQDFIDQQIRPFGPMPFFLGIGNHEVIPPKSLGEFVRTFSPWLDQPVLRRQRLADDPSATPPLAYYHWVQNGIDFIYLDNGSRDEFGPDQLRWLEKVLTSDEASDKVWAVIVGMHRALPDSLADAHSMSETEAGRTTGRQAYRDLLRAHSQGKQVYILASHSHFYMPNVFDTPALRKNGDVLPGWIIGTAGAYRYKLPPDAPKDAKQNVYGYLLATVTGREVRFEFKQIEESQVPANIAQRYSEDFVHRCFVENHE